MRLLYDHGFGRMEDGARLQGELAGSQRGRASIDLVRCRTERLVPVQDVAAELGLVQVHSPALCVGRGCSIHHPSRHHMRDWPRVWRGWHGYIERTCPHGIGHPDPDDLAYLFDQDPDEEAGRDVHGCDGCCR